MSVDSRSGSTGAKGSNFLDLDLALASFDLDLPFFSLPLLLPLLLSAVLPLAAESRLRLWLSSDAWL